MEYRQFIKKLDVPTGRAVPERLAYEDVVAEHSRARTCRRT
jgi:hypothetical protein